MGTGMFDFSGETILVSGSARGIGRTMVLQFSKAGARVIAVDRDAQGLSETQSICRSCITRTVDIRDIDAVTNLMGFIKEHCATLHVCINNAAVAPHQSLETYQEKVWDRVYDVNCKGTFLMTQAAGNLMRETGTKGTIINFSSAAAVKSGAGSAAYASSRAATEAFGRSAAIEFAPYGIRVNTIRPGLIDTQPKPLPPAMREGLEARIPTLPFRRAGHSEEVGNVALFLASSLASYITGSVITVDGGSLCGNYPDSKVTDDDTRYRWIYD